MFEVYQDQYGFYTLENGQRVAAPYETQQQVIAANLPFNPAPPSQTYEAQQQGLYNPLSIDTNTYDDINISDYDSPQQPVDMWGLPNQQIQSPNQGQQFYDPNYIGSDITDNTLRNQNRNEFSTEKHYDDINSNDVEDPPKGVNDLQNRYNVFNPFSNVGGYGIIGAFNVAGAGAKSIQQGRQEGDRGAVRRGAFATGAGLAAGLLGAGKSFAAGMGNQNMYRESVNNMNESQRKLALGNTKGQEDLANNGYLQYKSITHRDGGTQSGDIYKTTYSNAMPQKFYQDGGEQTTAVLSGRQTPTTSNLVNPMEVNSEVEHGEMVQQQGNISQVDGKRHSQGGEGVTLQEGDQVLTDDIRIPFAQRRDIEKKLGIKLKTTDTYSQAMEKYNKKIGLTELQKEQEDIFADLKKDSERDYAQTRQKETTEQVNQMLISKKINDTENAKNELKPLQDEAFNSLFEMQEFAKENLSENLRRKDGGLRKNDMEFTEGESYEYNRDGNRIKMTYQDGGFHVDNQQDLDSLRKVLSENKITKEEEVNNYFFKCGGMKKYQEGGMIQQGDNPQMMQQQAPQQDQMQQVVEQIAQALQQGAQPEEIVAQLAEMGMEQEQAIQLIQGVMQQMQTPQEQGIVDPMQGMQPQQFQYGGAKDMQAYNDSIVKHVMPVIDPSNDKVVFTGEGKYEDLKGYSKVLVDDYIVGLRNWWINEQATKNPQITNKRLKEFNEGGTWRPPMLLPERDTMSDTEITKYVDEAIKKGTLKGKKEDLVDLVKNGYLSNIKTKLGEGYNNLSPENIKALIDWEITNTPQERVGVAKTPANGTNVAATTTYDFPTAITGIEGAESQNVSSTENLSGVENIQSYQGAGYGQQMQDVDKFLGVHNWFFDTPEKQAELKKQIASRGSKPLVKDFQKAYNQKIRDEAKANGLDEAKIEELIKQYGFHGDKIQGIEGKLGAYTSSRPLFNFKKTADEVVIEPVVVDTPADGVIDPYNLPQGYVGRTPIVPVKPVLPPMGMIAPAYALPDYGKISPIKVDHIEATTGIQGVLRAQMQANQGRAGMQTQANLSQAAAQASGNINKAVSDVNRQNAAYKMQTDQVNLQQDNAQQNANVQGIQRYDELAARALANQDQSVRNYFDELYTQRIGAQRESRNLAMIDAMNPQFTFDQAGNVLYTPVNERGLTTPTGIGGGMYASQNALEGVSDEQLKKLYKQRGLA